MRKLPWKKTTLSIFDIFSNHTCFLQKTHVSGGGRSLFEMISSVTHFTSKLSSSMLWKTFKFLRQKSHQFLQRKVDFYHVDEHYPLNRTHSRQICSSAVLENSKIRTIVHQEFSHTKHLQLVKGQLSNASLWVNDILPILLERSENNNHSATKKNQVFFLSVNSIPNEKFEISS